MMEILQFIRLYWWFFLIPLGFVLMVLVVFNPRLKKGFEEDGRLPFADDEDRDKRP